MNSLNNLSVPISSVPVSSHTMKTITRSCALLLTMLLLIGCVGPPTIRFLPHAGRDAAKITLSPRTGARQLVAVDGIRLPPIDRTVVTSIPSGRHTFTVLDWEKLTHREFRGYRYEQGNMMYSIGKEVPEGHRILGREYGGPVGNRLIERTFTYDMPAGVETSWGTIESDAARKGCYRTAWMEWASSSKANDHERKSLRDFYNSKWIH